MAEPNYTLMQALSQYNADQVMVNTMWYIEIGGTAAAAHPELARMQIYGKNFTVPERTNTFEDVNYRGYPIPTPTNMTMGNSHSITIIADASGELRTGFLNWQARAIDPLINNQASSFGADRRPTAGVGGGILRLNMLAPNYEDIETQVTMYGVRVESVGSISLTNDSGSVATFDVGFRSVYWQISNSQNPAHMETAIAQYPAAEYLPAGGTNLNQNIASVLR